MAIKKQLVADSGILAQGPSLFNNTVIINGDTTTANVSGTNIVASANVSANNTNANNVNTANVVATVGVTSPKFVITGGSFSINSTAAVLPLTTVASTINAAAIKATSVNTGSANVVGSANVGGSLGVAGVTTFAANVNINGNLTVSGGVTTVNTTVLQVSDNSITLNSDVTGAPTEDAGIDINRGTANSVSLRWNETSKVWEVSNTLQGFARIHRSDVDVVLGTETSGNYVATLTGSSNGLTISGGTGEGSSPSIVMSLANTTTVGTVKLIDSVASANVTTAATPNSVKTAYDAAISANTLAAGKVSSVGGSTGRINIGGTSANPTVDLAPTGVTAGTWTKVTVDAYGRVTANANATTTDISEGTNQYFTTARARGSISQGTGISYDSASGVITNTDKGSDQLFFKNIADSVGTVQFAATTNQDTLRVAGGTGISVSFTGSPKKIIVTNDGVTSFNTRSGAVSLSSADVTGALGYTPVQSFNSRTGIVTLSSSDVTGALGYTPADAATAGGTNASALSTGTVPTGRMSGSYTGITQVGTLGTVTVSGAADADTFEATHSGGGTAAAPAFTFSVDSDTGMYRQTTNQIGWSCAGAQQMTLSTTTLTVNGNISCSTLTASSDERLKTDIIDITPEEGFDAVLNLEPVKYTRLDDGSNASGYIAQDFARVAPEQVTTTEDGYLGINVVGASPYHTAAIQFLANKIKTLEARIQTLEG
jgi:hypothetical protein